MRRDERTPKTKQEVQQVFSTFFFLLILCASFIFEVSLSLGDSCLDLIFTIVRERCGVQSGGSLQFCLRNLAYLNWKSLQYFTLVI